jgi:hypothetical protein
VLAGQDPVSLDQAPREREQHVTGGGADQPKKPSDRTGLGEELVGRLVRKAPCRHRHEVERLDAAVAEADPFAPALDETFVPEPLGEGAELRCPREQI